MIFTIGKVNCIIDLYESLWAIGLWILTSAEVNPEVNRVKQPHFAWLKMPDMNFLEITNSNISTIRKTNEFPARISVYDVIAIVTGQTHDHSSRTFRRLLEAYPEVRLQVMYKFPGQGQRKTPVVDFKGVIEILKILPGITTYSGIKFGERLANYMGVKYNVQAAFALPSIPRSPTKGIEEDTVERLLIDTELAYKKQERVGGYFVDYTIEREWGQILLEVDENQHSSYNFHAENKRIEAIKNAKDGTTIYLIRYNPHSYSCDGIKRKVAHETRKHTLKAILKKCMPLDEFNLLYVYYDMDALVPCIATDPHYPKDLLRYLRILDYASLNIEIYEKMALLDETFELIREENVRLRNEVGHLRKCMKELDTHLY